MKDNIVDCQVCGGFPIAVVKLFANRPFIDGRNYELICFTCTNVPKQWEYTKDGEINHWGYHDPSKLKTAKEMMEDGFDEKEFPLGEQQRLIQIFLLDKRKKAEVIAECRGFGSGSRTILSHRIGLEKLSAL